MGEVPEKILIAVKQEVENSVDKILSISEFANKYDISRKDLHYRFIHKYNISILEYHSRLKFCFFKILLMERNGSLLKTQYELAILLGFANDSSLHYFVKRRTGLKFRDFLKQYLEFAERTR